MIKIIDFGVSHPVVDSIAKSITVLCADSVPGMTTAQVAQCAADLADSFAKQITAQREIMVSRLQIIEAYQTSIKAGQEASLDAHTVEFCAALGTEDWRERSLDELRMISCEQLKAARLQWFRSEIYRLVAKGESMIEITAADYELVAPQHAQIAQR